MLFHNISNFLSFLLIKELFFLYICFFFQHNIVYKTLKVYLPVVFHPFPAQFVIVKMLEIIKMYILTAT